VGKTIREKTSLLPGSCASPGHPATVGVSPLTCQPPLLGKAQLPRVPSLTPRSRATCAIGLPVSNTSRTAPCLKSSSNFRYDLVIALPKGDVSTLRGEARRALQIATRVAARSRAVAASGRERCHVSS
jgi:hypothetical protein